MIKNPIENDLHTEIAVARTLAIPQKKGAQTFIPERDAETNILVTGQGKDAQNNLEIVQDLSKLPADQALEALGTVFRSRKS